MHYRDIHIVVAGILYVYSEHIDRYIYSLNLNVIFLNIQIHIRFTQHIMYEKIIKTINT